MSTPQKAARVVSSVVSGECAGVVGPAATEATPATCLETLVVSVAASPIIRVSMAEFRATSLTDVLRYQCDGRWWERGFRVTDGACLVAEYAP